MMFARVCKTAGLALGVSLGGGCGASSGPSSPAEAASEAPPTPRRRATALLGWHYTVTPKPSLDTADIRVCFEGAAPQLLIPGIALGMDHTHDVRTDGGEPLSRKGRGYDLAPLPDNGCVRYRVDFKGLSQARGSGRIVARRGESLLARPSAWLWRPDMIPAGFESTIAFELPPDVSISVPWAAATATSTGPTYRLDDSAFFWLGYAVFGAITIDRFEHAGAAVELVTLDAEIACPPAGLRAWVIDALDSVALLFDGRFPRDRLQVVVLPVPGRDGGTVYFGMATRGGGSGVFVFLDDHAVADDLPGGWTTVHELLHHGMPFIEEPWMAEGWVSYYTELMRTRMGHRSEQEGWEALHEAFGRGSGRGSDMTLAEASAQMHDRHVYQRVYWGGAATAFLVDVQMRIETDGKQGLDDAMKELRRCCGDADHRWPAAKLLAHLDDWYGRPLFSETAATILREPGMPDIDAAFARLGISTQGGLRLDDEHPAAAARRAIMAPR